MPRHRRLLVAGALFAAAVIVGGCSLVNGINDTKRDLERSGFLDPSVSVKASSNYDIVRVNYSEPPPGETNPDLQAARIVWETFPLSFDRVDVRSQSYQHDELLNRFGNRPSQFDKRSISQEFTRIGERVIISIVVAGVIALGAIILIVWLVIRTNRRRRSPTAPWGPGGWGYPGPAGGWGPAPPVGGWPPQPPTQGWGPPPPPPPGWPAPPPPPPGWPAPPPPPPGWPAPPPPPQGWGPPAPPPEPPPQPDWSRPAPERPGSGSGSPRPVPPPQPPPESDEHPPN